MVDIEVIYDFLAQEIGVKKEQFGESSDLYREFGMEGDDCFEFEEHFAEKFNVNMESFLWYFHHAEEGVFSIGAVFFKPPYTRVNRIPITPKMLLNSVNTRSWYVDYPSHKTPSKRYDLVANKITLLVLAGLVLCIWVVNI